MVEVVRPGRAEGRRWCHAECPGCGCRFNYTDGEARFSEGLSSEWRAVHAVRCPDCGADCPERVPNAGRWPEGSE